MLYKCGKKEITWTVSSLVLKKILKRSLKKKGTGKEEWSYESTWVQMLAASTTGNFWIAIYLNLHHNMSPISKAEGKIPAQRSLSLPMDTVVGRKRTGTAVTTPAAGWAAWQHSAVGMWTIRKVLNVCMGFSVQKKHGSDAERDWWTDRQKWSCLWNKANLLMEQNAGGRRWNSMEE